MPLDSRSGDKDLFAFSAQPGTVASMDRLLASQTVAALQSLVEACYALAADLPNARQEKVEKLLIRVQQARATIMAELM